MDEKDKDGKDVEIRSEEVQELLGSVPHWILKNGIFFLALCVGILFLGSWLFRYPDVVSSTLTLTTSTPPAKIVAKSSGKIVELRVSDQQVVKKGDCLAIIENTAHYEDILFIDKEIKRFIVSRNDQKTFILKRENLKLGAVQASFSSFLLSLKNYNEFVRLNYYPRKIASINQLMEANKKNYNNALKQAEITQKQHNLNLSIFKREDILRKKEMISEEESDKAKGQLLQSEMSLQNMQSTLESFQIQIMQMKGELVDIEQQYSEKKNAIFSELNTSINQLQNEISSWKMTYLLESPLDGKVTFTDFWCVNQNITAGQIVFSVVPIVQSDLIGRAQLPVERSGKVKVGQRVLVHFVNYPDAEFGMVQGVVSRISLIPTDGKYTVEVKFPKGLMSSYGKNLPLSQEITANAQIITEDLHLIDQLFSPIKKIFKGNL
jgi:multidrug resistance efflux pump